MCLTIPPLGTAKARVADAPGSSATKSESRQTMLCDYLSAGLLLGLSLNALLGWWWADPITALGIAAVALKGGRNAWRGEACFTAPIAGAEAMDARMDAARARARRQKAGGSRHTSIPSAAEGGVSPDPTPVKPATPHLA